MITRIIQRWAIRAVIGFLFWLGMCVATAVTVFNPSRRDFYLTDFDKRAG